MVTGSKWREGSSHGNTEACVRVVLTLLCLPVDIKVWYNNARLVDVLLLKIAENICMIDSHVTET